MTKQLLGVLGGMGPLATADFMRKLIVATPATRDQDHLPLIVYSVPQIPDRTVAILSGGESPLPALLHGLRTLEAARASAIAIPCNTAHYWADELARATALPILHIADAVLGQLRRRCAPESNVALIGTQGTVHAGFYQKALGANGYACMIPTPEELCELVMPGIDFVKQGDLEQGGRKLEIAVRRLLERGAATVVLACTEIPLAMDHLRSPLLPQCLDSTAALADDCVAWWQRVAGAARPRPAEAPRARFCAEAPRVGPSVN